MFEDTGVSIEIITDTFVRVIFVGEGEGRNAIALRGNIHENILTAMTMAREFGAYQQQWACHLNHHKVDWDVDWRFV
jgi:hypothetical protein